jgi:hypothetical protein
MAAAAAALPPSLRATATADADSGNVQPMLQGLGFNPPAGAATLGSTPVVVLPDRGLEPPVFMSQLVPAASAGGELVAGLRHLAVHDERAMSAAAAAAGSQEQSVMSSGLPAPPAASPGFGRLLHSQPQGFMGSLFGKEVAAAAGPGAVPLSKQQGLVSMEPADFVPLLFGAPAPASASAAGAVYGLGFGGQHSAESWDKAPSGDQLRMSEDQFGREVLGIGGSAVAAAANGTSRRSSKRQRQMPAKFAAGSAK